ncbi:Methionine aminotransferase [Polaribacter huanghezhanensis]|uniref:methionine aminotransferase n=1 Tax=Polaribacter huanghezhanensis TaxID=1354726 RepID=UPI002649449F|nr:methionine aminotransferase [Polaribacter huanghezhanensis]WKD86681.1 Methionine aminotransferase [Polaribacter huanghezhanensis]
MTPISKLPNLETNIFTIMGNLAKKHNAINLAQGFPNFNSDQKLNDLVTKAMNSGYNQYAPMHGVLALRDAIAQKFEGLYQSTYNPENEIVITVGATQAIFTIITTFIHPLDEVILFKPAYDCYEPAIKLNGGKVIPIQLTYPGYEVDWNKVKNAITANTKMIVINTPQNPCGTVFSKEDMQQLELITNNTNIIVLSDEVYEHMVFDGLKHQSACLFPQLKERTFITASFGKTFHNTGWKIGYCCGPKELMKEFLKVHQFNVFCVNHPTQIALAEYINEPNNYEQLNLFYEDKRNTFLEAIKDSKFTFIPSKATYFQVLNYSGITQINDIDFAKKLTVEFGVASIPISVFNTNNLDEKVVRFCFAKKDETLQKSAEILNKLE